MNLTTNLQALERPIQVGVVGSGIFGSQLVHAIEATPGMETAVLADIDESKAIATLRRTGVGDERIERVEDAAEVTAVAGSERRAVTRNSDAVASAEIDIVVEATGNPNVAAKLGFETLLSGTHFLNVSVEADTVCGPLLASIARSNDAVYTLAAGDQPGQIASLYQWATSSGFEVVSAGILKSTDPEPYGTPEDSIERHGHIASFGEGIDPDPEMYNTFLDGTKLAVESVAAANALGFGIDTTGMHHPSVSTDEIPEVLRTESDGGVLGKSGVIDSVTAADRDITVFVVTRTESEQLREYYTQRPKVITSDDGTHQLFYRPYHFAPQTTRSIASAVIFGEPTGAPIGHEAEVVAAAKRDLGPGETIDGGGGYTIYGLAEDADRATERGYVPFELLEGAEVLEPLERDEVITFEDVELDTEQPMYHMRKLQDGLGL